MVGILVSKIDLITWSMSDIPNDKYSLIIKKRLLSMPDNRFIPLMNELYNCNLEVVIKNRYFLK